MNFARVVLVFGIFYLAFGISCPGTERTDSFEKARTAIYARTSVTFEKVHFLKPTEQMPDPMAVKLAPLLMLEQGERDHESAPAKLVVSNGCLTLDTNLPTLYFAKAKVNVKGDKRDQALFLWFCLRGEGIASQGVRITLDGAGQPVIWEILNDTSGVKQIFASQSMEAAAFAEFKVAQSNRRSFLERAVSEMPNVVVSRLISDAPMTMGPAIYLTADKHDVSTLLCRCMPPQAKELLETRTYEIEILNGSLKKHVAQLLNNLKEPGFSLEPGDAERRLERELRLPDKF